MNFCQRCRARLGEFLDGTLSASEREKVAAHLQTCAACAAEKREIELVRAAMSELRPQKAPENLRLRVRNTLQNEAETARNRRDNRFSFLFLPRYAWAGTGSLAALALLLLAQPFSQNPRVVPEAPPPAQATAPMEEIAPKSAKIQTQSVPKKPASPAPKPTAPKPKTLNPKPAGQNSPLANSGAENRNADSVFVPAPRDLAPLRREAAIENRNRSAASPLRQDRAVSRSPIEPPVSVAPPDIASAPMTRSQNAAPMSARATQPTAPTGRKARFNMAITPLQNEAEPRQIESFAAPPASEMAPKTAPEIAAAPVAPPAPATRDLGDADASAPRGDGENAQSSAAMAQRNRAPALEDRPLASAPDDRAEKSRFRTAPRRAASQTATSQFFGLQIRASRAIENAQIRVVLPSPLRFASPDAGQSQIVWTGDLEMGKPAKFDLEIVGARGGEKITVRVEQKAGAAPSKLLETQTLLLPARSR